MELIRKQTVLNLIDNLQFGDCGTATERLTKLYDAVENQPSVDSVEVVRCKDCKYFYKTYDEPYCALWSRFDTEVPKETDFCSWAERKTDG